MTYFWFRPTFPSTWHVVRSWPDGRKRVIAARRSQHEADLKMQRSAGRLLDRHSDLGPRAVARGIALCDQGVVHTALTIERCEVPHCASCAPLVGGA